MHIDSITYNKARIIPYDPNRPCGYQPRSSRLTGYRSLIVHTTNGRKGTTLHAEAQYIAYSRDISAHYLIGKQGEIIQFLDPRFYIAYHAGCVKATAYSNIYAAGIEMHNTPTEGHITDAQFYALDWLTRKLLADLNIQAANVETHRNVAVFCGTTMLGRKIDPSGFPDSEFYAWRKTLFPAVVYRVINPKGVYIRQAPKVDIDNVAGVLLYNDTFIGGDIKDDENGQYINGTNKWVHLKYGTSNGVPVDGLGFVHMSNLIW